MQQVKNYVLIVDPNREHIAVEGLNRRGIDAYTPSLWRRQRGPRNTIRHVRRPMFPCYAFVALRAGYEDWLAVEAVPGVWRFLNVDGRPAWLPAEAIEAIRDQELALDALYKSQANAGPAGCFSIGQDVRARIGPYSDVLARIERFDERGRVVVLMNMLGASREVTVRPSELMVA
jgi:transcription antitermination factor NusG